MCPIFVIKFSGVSDLHPRFPIDFAGHRYNSAALPHSLWCLLVSQWNVTMMFYNAVAT